MDILLYRDGLAVDAVACPDGSTVSGDRSVILLPDGTSIAAPSEGLWYVAPDGGRIGWVLVSGAPAAPEPDLSVVKEHAVERLKAACATAIVGGFESAALGAAHAYPSKETDQINLMGSVTASLLPGLAEGWTTPFWCRDGSGVWAYRDHDAAQIQAAGADGKTHVVECQTLLALLTAEVEGAADAAAVAAITWG